MAAKASLPLPLIVTDGVACLPPTGSTAGSALGRAAGLRAAAAPGRAQHSLYPEDSIQSAARG